MITNQNTLLFCQAICCFSLIATNLQHSSAVVNFKEKDWKKSSDIPYFLRLSSFSY